MRTTIEDNKKLNYTLSVLMIVGALYAFLFTGCASGWLYEEKPHQQEAVAVAMKALGAEGKKPPNIFWHEPEDLNCQCWVDDKGEPQTIQNVTYEQGANGWDSDGTCVSGLHGNKSFLEGPAWIELGWLPPRPFHQMAMAHELGHAASKLLTGDGDSNHKSVFFASDGPVEQAIKAMAMAGY